MKKLKSAILFILISGHIFCQNQVQIANQSVIPGQVFYVEVEINNTEPFVALQLDLPIPDVFSLIDQSVELNPARIAGHDVQFSVMTGGAIRIICYSANNSPVSGNSGWFVRFQLEAGTVPDNYDLGPQDVLLANVLGENILSGISSGTIQILAPEINITPMEINFGKTAVSQQTDRSFNIQNNGTHTLAVTNLIIPDNQFTANIQTPLNINAGQSSSVTLTFTPTWKGQYDFPLTIQSDDPDEPELEVNIQAESYTINEIHVGSMFAFSDNEAELLVSINNMEEFAAVQFDLVLPDPLQYIDGSVTFSGRNTNHEISAQQFENNHLRLVAFSSDNSTFTGIDGDLIKIRFHVNGTGGHYSIPVQNGMIGHKDGSNILSAQYGGSLEVAAADISCSNNMNFGEVSSLENKTLELQLNNYGSDELVIDHIEFSGPSFTSSTTFPLTIPISQNNTISVQYENSVKGTYSGTLRIYSNDPDESPFPVQLSGETFIPNYIIIPNQQYASNQDIWLEVWVENYENFVALQFDLNYPFNNFNCLVEQAELSARLPDHQLQLTENQDGIIKVLIYSLNQTPANGQDGSVIKLKFSQDQATEGTFDFTLSNCILGNTSSDDILYGSQNGQITTINLPYAPILGQAENITQTSSSISWEIPNGSPIPESFLIDVSDNPGFTSFVSNYDQLDIGQVYSYNLSNLPDNQNLFCRLRAIRSGFPGPYSNVISFSTLPYLPWPVSLNEADQITTTGARISWIPNYEGGGDPSGYKLEISYNSDFTNYVPGYELLNINNVTEYIVNDLLPCNLYHFRILPYNEAGEGNTSIIKTFTTLSIPPESPVCNAPTNVTNSSFEANWEASQSGCDPTGYFLEVATDNQFTSKVTGFEHLDVGAVLSKEVTGLDPLVQYYYRIQGYNTGGNGSYSNTINVTTLNTIIEIKQIIPLVQGWNWLSFNTLPENPSLANVLETYVATNNDEIKTAPALGGSATYYGGTWYGLNNGIQPGVMYLLNTQTQNPKDITITGLSVDVSTPIPIVENWNWIGFNPQTSLGLGTALASLESENNDEIKTAPALGGSATYYGGIWYGLNDGLKPGIGYLLNSSKADELIYPADGSPVIPITPLIADNKMSEKYEIWINPSGLKNTMTVHAKVVLPSGEFLEASGSMLAAFKNNKCRGVFELFDGPVGKQFQLAIASNLENETDINYLVLNAENNKIYKINEKLDFELNTTLGKIHDPIYLTIGSILDIDEYLNRGKSIVFNTYPNPFTDKLNISFTNPKPQKVYITLFDGYGRKVRIIEDKTYQMGTYTIGFDTQNLPNGVYYIRMKTYNFTQNKKIVKAK